MNQKAWKTVLSIAGFGLAIAGFILFLLSVFTEKDTLKWGMLCIALGNILTLILTQLNKKAP